MNRVSVRCYAELNDLLPVERRQRTFELEFEGSPTVREVLARLGVPAEAVEVAFVGGRSVGLAHSLRDGDRLACYPLFERYDVAPLLQIRERPQRRPRFTVAAELRALAMRLRALGFDAALAGEPSAPDEGPGGRIVLVRPPVPVAEATHLLAVDGRSPREQLRGLVRRLGLEGELDRPPRCLRCNVVLVPAPSAPAGSQPSHGAATGVLCPRCGHRASSPPGFRLKRSLERSFSEEEGSLQEDPVSPGSTPQAGG